MARAFGKPVSQSPAVVVAPAQAADSLDDVAVGENIGSFYGFLRRTKATKTGMLVQIFGENGPDADAICALGLTKYQETPIKMTIWMVKDKDGRIMREPDGKPVELAAFIGMAQRPRGTEFGQTALLFAENGANADAANRLNETRFQDALVLVDLQKAIPGTLAGDIPSDSPDSDIIAAGADRLTESEAVTLKKHQKKAEQVLTLLRQNGFFRNEAVLRALGTDADYQEWLTSQMCCHPQPGLGQCPLTPIFPYEVLGTKTKQYNWIPFCQEHRDEWSGEATPDVGPQGNQAFLLSQVTIAQQRWAQDALRRTLQVPVGYLPSVNLVYRWALDHNLRTALPPGFNALLDP